MEYLLITHHFAKVDGYRACGSRDITYLIFHVTLQDHVIKGSCDFMEGSSSLYATTARSGGYKQCGGGDVFNSSRDFT